MKDFLQKRNNKQEIELSSTANPYRKMNEDEAEEDNHKD